MKNENKEKKLSVKAGTIFATMIGIVDGTFGAGTTDKMMRDAMEGKDNDKILDDIIGNRRVL